MLTATIFPSAINRRNKLLLLGLLLVSTTLLAGSSGRIGGGESSFSSPSRSAPSTPSKSYSAPASSTKPSTPPPASSSRSGRLGAGESVGLQRKSSAYEASASKAPTPSSGKALTTAVAPSTFPVGAVVTGAAIGYMVGKSGKDKPPATTSNTGSTGFYPNGSASPLQSETNLTRKDSAQPSLGQKPVVSPASNALASDPDLKPQSAPAAENLDPEESPFQPWYLLLVAVSIPLIFLWRRRKPKPESTIVGNSQLPFRGDFLTRATVLFDILQGAHQQGDAAQLRQYLTNHCYHMLYGAKPPKRSEVSVKRRSSGQLGDWTPEHSPPLASIRFRGKVIEEGRSVASDFVEDWHFSWQEDDWKLAGITQVKEA